MLFTDSIILAKSTYIPEELSRVSFSLSKLINKSYSASTSFKQSKLLITESSSSKNKLNCNQSLFHL